MSTSPTLSVVIPCLNEQIAIADVVREYRAAFPDAEILVIDNGSTDETARVAREAGALVLTEPRRGKAQAVLTALHHVDTDVLIMVDGDMSYPAEGARLLFAKYQEQPVDMITGVRTSEDSAHRPMHQLGTRAFAGVVDAVFDCRAQDVFSGLRLFSRRFYMNVPILSRGFELEMEFTIQAVDKGFTMLDVPVPFRKRAVGTSSKLKTVSDGLRILRLMFVLYRDYRPFAFFGWVSGLLFVAGALAGSLPIHEYILTSRVGRFPLAFLAASLMVMSLFSFQTGVTLQSSLRYSREAFQVRMRRYRASGALPPEEEALGSIRPPARRGTRRDTT